MYQNSTREMYFDIFITAIHAVQRNNHSKREESHEGK